MTPSATLSAVIDGRRYRVATATLLASDCYWDGQTWERRGNNTYLYRTPNGAFFVVHLSQWQGVQPERIEALTAPEAQGYWEALREHELDYEDAFPGAPVVDA